jgi:hypothetical protein
LRLMKGPTTANIAHVNHPCFQARAQYRREPCMAHLPFAQTCFGVEPLLSDLIREESRVLGKVGKGRFPLITLAAMFSRRQRLFLQRDFG